MRLMGVRVISLRTCAGRNLKDFAHRDEFIEGVIDGRDRDLRETLLREKVYSLSAEVDVFALENLHDGAPLGRHPPFTYSKSLKKVVDRSLPCPCVI